MKTDNDIIDDYVENGYQGICEDADDDCPFCFASGVVDEGDGYGPFFVVCKCVERNRNRLENFLELLGKLVKLIDKE